MLPRTWEPLSFRWGVEAVPDRAVRSIFLLWGGNSCKQHSGLPRLPLHIPLNFCLLPGKCIRLPPPPRALSSKHRVQSIVRVATVGITALVGSGAWMHGWLSKQRGLSKHWAGSLSSFYPVKIMPHWKENKSNSRAVSISTKETN